MDIHSNILKHWQKMLFVSGVVIFLAACTNSPATPTPAPVTECPTYAAPTQVSFDDLWASSAHADSAAAAFTHWDDTNPKEIPATCAGCHSRMGFLDYLGVDGSAPDVVDKPANTGTVVTCYVCHNEGAQIMDYVIFPSGKRIGGLGREAACITCHHGLASTPTVENAITKANVPDDDTQSVDLQFINSHSTSAATPFGSEVEGAYQYAGKTYHGRYMRGEDFFPCYRCHNQHTLELNVGMCSECHTFDGIDVKNIRVNSTDFDGDGNSTEGIFFEIEQLQADLLLAIQAYAVNVVKVPIAYSLDSHPYFFIDTNNNGQVDPEEANTNNKYVNWTPRLLRAAYNYNYAAHDAGSFAHNSTYILQVLYDSLVDIGGDASGLTRP